MPGSWSDFLKLRSGPAPAPSPEAGAVRVYADSDGALRSVQSDGTDAPIGGGAAFNGGTITEKLKIDGTAVSGTLLDLVSAGSWEVDVTKTDQGGGVIDAEIDLRGDGGGRSLIVLQNSDRSSTTHVGSDQITLDSNSNIATDILGEVSSSFWGTILTVFADHVAMQAPLKFTSVPVLQKHSAPSDVSLAAGDCALWFDQTDGAAKLMVKAKTADGTVVAAAIALT